MRTRTCVREEAQHEPKNLGRREFKEHHNYDSTWPPSVPSPQLGAGLRSSANTIDLEDR